jgi:FKBP-type peptidyl-prolyl cis-trans isomerase
VIKGWDMGIKYMQLGEKCELHIMPEYAYGAMGAPPLIPGNAKLIFVIELLMINDRQASRWQMEDPQLV